METSRTSLRIDGQEETWDFAILEAAGVDGSRGGVHGLAGVVVVVQEEANAEQILARSWHANNTFLLRHH